METLKTKKSVKKEKIKFEKPVSPSEIVKELDEMLRDHEVYRP